MSRRLTFTGIWNAAEYRWTKVHGDEFPKLLTTGRFIPVPCKVILTIKPERVSFSFNETEAIVEGETPENKTWKGFIVAKGLEPVISERVDSSGGEWLTIRFTGKYHGPEFEEISMDMHLASRQFSIHVCWPHRRWKGDYKRICTQHNLFYLDKASAEKYLAYAAAVR